MTENKQLLAEIEKQKEHSILEKEKAILAVEKAHQKELKEIQLQHQKDYKELMEQIDKLQEQRNNKINEVTELKLQNNELQGKIKEFEGIIADLRKQLSGQKTEE